MLLSLFLFIPTFFYLALPLPAQAFCPVCTVALGGGLAISRWLGVDDAVTGIWIGAFTLYLAFWFIAWINRKKSFKNGWLSLLVIILSYLLTYLFLQLLGAYTGQNLIFGLERVAFGMLLGSLILPPSLIFEKYLRQKNAGRAYFYFQKTVIPLSFLFLANLLLHYFLK